MTNNDDQSYVVGGIRISAVNMPMALERIGTWIAGPRPRLRAPYVCVADAHSLLCCQDDPALRMMVRCADMVTPDGMPLVWLARLCGHGHVGRVYGPDLMQAAFAASRARGWRHFLYGGRPEVAERLEEVLRRSYPGVEIVGRHSPPFRPLTQAEECEDWRRINAARPDIVWVGLGAPKQERWMARSAAHLDGPVLVGVGAAFDFLSGSTAQAPRWIRQNGFEWLFRALVEPRRLVPRYTVVVPRFLLLVVREALERLRARIAGRDYDAAPSLVRRPGGP